MANTIEIIRNNLTSSVYQNVPIASAGGSSLTISNLGAGSGVFGSQTTAEAFFKSLVPGDNIGIIGNDNTLTISFTGTAGSSVSISGLATSGFVVGVSGVLQNQITILNNNTGNYYLNSNPSGYINGFNSGIYITTGQTGQFYPIFNPNNYSTSGNLQSTGSNLDSKINSLSGYSNNNFATIVNLAATGSNLQNQINSLNNNTGNYYLNSNPNSYSTSGNLQSTGIDLLNKINILSGNSVLRFGDQLITGNKTFNNSIIVPIIYSLSDNQNYINLDNKSLYFANTPTLNWETATLNQISGGATLNWNLRYTYDASGNYSIGWNDRILYGLNNNPSIDWVNRDLTGNWTKNSYYILTSIDSGNLQSSINNLSNNTGNYYLNSNPSGFITGSYASNTYVNTGFVPKGRYNSLSINAGAFAPLSSGGATSSSVAFSNTHYFDIFSFDAASENGITFQFSLPDVYNNGSLKSKLFWGVASGGSSGVVFSLCGRAYISGDSLNQSFGSETLVTGYATNSGIVFENTSNYINLTGTITGASSLVLIKISRKVNDSGDVCNKAAYLYNCNMQWKESVTEPSLWS